MTMFGDGILRRGVRDGGILARRDEAPREVFVYGVIGPSSSTSEQVVKFNQSGELIWSLSGPDLLGGSADQLPRRCASDGENLFILAADGTIAKLGSDGTIIWNVKPVPGSRETWSECSICVDPDGCVYYGRSNGRVRKLDSDGNLLWENSDYTFRSDVRSIACDYRTRSIFWAGGDVNDARVIRIDADSGETNAPLMTSYSGGIARSIAVDPDNERVFYSRSSNNLFCVDFNGNQIWSQTYPSQPAFDGLAYRPDVLICHFTSGGPVGRLDPDNGDLIWLKTPVNGSPARGIDLDAEGRIYTGGTSAGKIFRQLAPDGAENWSYLYPDLQASLSDIATTAGVYSAFG